jgi:hypothetical protein
LGQYDHLSARGRYTAAQEKVDAVAPEFLVKVSCEYGRMPVLGALSGHIHREVAVGYTLLYLASIDADLKSTVPTTALGG